MLQVIGKNIRTARLKAGLTQECLAELLGVHVQTLSNVERGVYPFSVTTFVLIKQYLGVDAELLLADITEPDNGRTERIKRLFARRRKPAARG